MQSQQKNYYQILQLTQLATLDQIKRAYRKLAIQHHPDKNMQNQGESLELFRKISQAYQTLSDSDKKRDYDKANSFNFNFTTADGKYSFNDAKTLFQNFFKNSTQRYYSKGEDVLDSFINGKRVSRPPSTPSNHKPASDSFRYYNMGTPSHSIYHKNDQSQASAAYQNLFKKQSLESNPLKQRASSFSMDQQSSSNVSQSSIFTSDFDNNILMRSTSTVTKTINGKVLKVKKTTVKKKDGTRQVKQEIFDDMGLLETKNYVLAIGQTYPNFTLTCDSSSISANTKAENCFQ